MATNDCNKIATFDYLRKSTKGISGDKERQEKSISQQRAELDKLAFPRELASAGYDKFEVTGTFTDEGVSGWKLGTRRPGFHRMVQAIQANPAKDKVIRVDDLDRFSRASVDDTQDVARTLKQAGVRWIVSASQGVFDLGRNGNDIGEILRFVIAAWGSHEYSRKLGRRVALARRNRAKVGERCGSKAPYGYRNADSGKSLEIDDESAIANVRWMFEQFAAGKSLWWIASDLNRRKVKPGKSAALWYPSTVRLILANPSYCGRFDFGRCRQGKFYSVGESGEVLESDTEGKRGSGGTVFSHKGKWPPAVSEALFAKVNDRLQTFKTGRKPRANGFALSRILVCDHCGRHLEAAMVNGRATYRCKASRIRPGEKCGNQSIREEQILPFLIDLLGEELDALAASKLAPNAPKPEPARDYEAEAKALRKKIEAAEDRILEIADKRTRQSLDTKITGWRDELDELIQSASEPDADDAGLAMLAQWWSAAKATILPVTVDADSRIAKALSPDAAAEAAKPMPWTGWVADVLGREPGVSFVADIDRRALNEVLHSLGCEVRLRWRTEQRAQKRRYFLERGRFRLGQKRGSVVLGSVHTSTLMTRCKGYCACKLKCKILKLTCQCQSLSACHRNRFASLWRHPKPAT